MKRLISIMMAILIVCMSTVSIAFAEGTRSVTVSYDKTAAVQYAREFAKKKNNGIFKPMGLDCTNFVSQCLWAGYGGTAGCKLTETEKLRQRVANNYRQTSTWYGRSANSPYQHGSGSFIRVIDLWDYITTNNGYGPRADGYNDNKCWLDLETVPQLGDILQIYSTSSGRYGHSVIVTKINASNLTVKKKVLWPENIVVSQHTFEERDRTLADILDWYGYDCKIRLIRPKTATFSN